MSPATRRRPRALPRYWLQPPDAGIAGDALQESVVLAGATREADVTQAIAAAPLRASTSSAGQITLSVIDPDRQLMGPLLDRDEDLLLDDNIDCDIGGITWRLMGLQPRDDGWELLLEDRAAAWLRRHTKNIKATRGRVTRARFVHRLYQEAGGGIPLYVPELHDKQQIAKTKRPTTTARGTETTVSATKAGDRKWPASSKPRVKRLTATSAQTRAIAEILEECRRQGCSRRVMIATVMCATQESTIAPLSHGDAARNDTIGYFQQGPEWIAPRNTSDATLATRAFLLGSREAKAGGTGNTQGWKQRHGLRNGAGSLETKLKQVQISIGGYSQWEDEATRTVDLWLEAGGGGGRAASGDRDTTGRAGAYIFERSPDGLREDSLTCVNRLAAEVGGWRHWVFGGCGVFASDEELITAPVGLTIDRSDEAVVSGPSWKWDVRKPASEASVDILVDRLPEPGQVAMVEDEGPASGLWLVTSIDCDLAQPVDTANGRLALRCTVGLARPQATKPEPAPEYAAAASHPDATSDGPLERNGNKVRGGSVRDRIVFAAKEAARLHANGQRRSYYTDPRVGGTWSVSKGITGESGPPIRSDCSQWVTAMYWSAGAGDPNGQNFRGGYTGSLYANADRVSSPLPGDLAMYGPPPGIHVELYVGGGKTIGHGSPPVDYGTPRMRSDFNGFWRPRVLKEGKR